MDNPDPLTTAMAWIVSVALGQAATSIAVIAVAGLGFAMLQGRVSYRDGLRVALGCAMLFGAPAIARGLIEMVGDTPPPSMVTPVDHPPLAARPVPTDPYAGASLPQ